MSLDKVHIIGMSENGSTYLTVNEFEGITVEPPIHVVLEGENTSSVAVIQGDFAARYDEGELRLIGEGNSMQGLHRVIGDIAMNDGLEQDAIKPLHPTMFEGDYEDVVAELPLASREITARSEVETQQRDNRGGWAKLAEGVSPFSSLL